jgi:hypothetical protein
MNQTNPQGSDEGLGTSIGRFVVNTLSGMILPVPVSGLAAVLVAVLIRRLLSSSLNADHLWLCLTFPVGCALGFLFNRDFPRREACWVWISGLVWLALGVWESVRFYHPRSAHGCSVTENAINALLVMDGRKCEGDESGLAAVFYTMPALSSIAYSLGAWIARRRGPRAKGVSPSANSI